jgi:hypothetical protein
VAPNCLVSQMLLSRRVSVISQVSAYHGAFLGGTIVLVNCSASHLLSIMVMDNVRN